MNKRQELADLVGGTVPESKQLFNIEPIPNTPFTKVETEDKAFLALGKYRLTEDFPEPGQVMEYFENNFWEILLKVITCVFNEMKKHESIEGNFGSTNDTDELS